MDEEGNSKGGPSDGILPPRTGEDRARTPAVGGRAKAEAFLKASRARAFARYRRRRYMVQKESESESESELWDCGGWNIHGGKKGREGMWWGGKILEGREEMCCGLNLGQGFEETRGSGCVVYGLHGLLGLKISEEATGWKDK